MRLAPIFAFAFSAGAAFADTVDTPKCRADLARANQLINDIDARQNSVKSGDMAGLCALLRRNRTDMTEATRIMDRCFTGHEHRENVGQMAASLGDINTVLARRCK
jgi:hypothetical protein